MKRTVGILSMQKVLNYGSFLQAYALRQLLLQIGLKEVFFLDIEPGFVLSGYRPTTQTKRILNAIKLLFKGKLLTKIRDLKFDKKMRNSISANLSILQLDKKPEKKFDLVIIGSDEVFNCCQTTNWGYTTQLYGNVPQAKQVISYAGSFGHTTYEQLVEYGLANEIGTTMKTMSAISVRDENSFNIVERLTHIKPQIHLDPVLIYGYHNEINMYNIEKNEKYLIIYSYQGRIKDKNEINDIVSFAKSKSLKLISIFCRYDWCNEAVIPPTPFHVLAWFNKAEYVITDTFHGTIFSIITHRKFCTLIRDTNQQKLTSLLKHLGLEAQGTKHIGQILEFPINYTKVEEILKREKERSLAYLKEQID